MLGIDFGHTNRTWFGFLSRELSRCLLGLFSCVTCNAISWVFLPVRSLDAGILGP